MGYCSWWLPWLPGAAMIAALLVMDYTVEIIDAIAERMTWSQFEARLRARLPKYYVTHITVPTLQNDMYGVFLANAVRQECPNWNRIAVDLGQPLTPTHATTPPPRL